MKGIRKVIKVCLIAGGVLLLLLVVSLLPDIFYFAPKAKPPSSVVDFNSFFAWRADSKWAWRITVSNEIYYQLPGPAGRLFASGPAAYAFDSNGRYIGWTSDSGDFFQPAAVYAPGAKRERITIDEVRKLLTNNATLSLAP